MNVNLGIPNPAYVTHPSLAASRRIHVDGFSDSDYGISMALLQFNDGKIGMVVDGTDASFESLVKVHQIMTMIVAEMDRRIQLHALTVPGEL